MNKKYGATTLKIAFLKILPDTTRVRAIKRLVPAGLTRLPPIWLNAQLDALSKYIGHNSVRPVWGTQWIKDRPRRRWKVLFSTIYPKKLIFAGFGAGVGKGAKSPEGGAIDQNRNWNLICTSGALPIVFMRKIVKSLKKIPVFRGKLPLILRFSPIFWHF